MKTLQTHPIALDPEMVAFLEAAAQEYGLPDTGKAVRCLINYAREQPERRDEIFAEIRCTAC